MKYLIILLFISQIGFAQNNFSFKVLNSSDNNPIQFVNASLEGTTFSTQSDERGIVTISFESGKNKTIILSHVGFETKKIQLSELSSSSEIVVHLQPKIFSSQTILVKGSIGKEGETPISFSKIKREELIENYSNQDVPEMLSNLPSVSFYSENGNGIGYNYLSIRGFDQRRISVSINGIPQNDPEDHNVYWLDFPDLIENTEIIQVQRGAGSGMIGYPAIGGSVNIITSSFSDKKRVELSSSIGSYNTNKSSILISSGLIENKYSFSAKLSQIKSSGYRDLSWSNLKSYHFSAVRFDDKLTSQINIYGGLIEDGLAYTGIPKFAIKDLKLRRANYSYWEEDKNEITYSTLRKPSEIENFSQPHFELLNEYKLNEDVVLNSALFLVLGNGFFDYDGSWADSSYFRLTKENGFQVNQNPSNALIRAMVNNKQWGWIPRISIKHNNGELIVGGEYRVHNSLHWGSIEFAENLPQGLPDNYKYYQYNGSKNILSFYANENYSLNEKINLLGEIQIAYHKYKLFDEKYVGSNFSVSNLFVNPRIGINYKLTPASNIYFSIARVSREPRLKNYYDAAESSGGEIPQFEKDVNGKYDFTKPLVKSETMNNIELGTTYSDPKYSVQLNTYYMQFNNEIVKKGQLDRFGQPITGNMERTIHYGLEFSLTTKITDGLEFVLNSSISKNYISEGNAFTSVRINGTKKQEKISLAGNTIAGFPNSLLTAILQYKKNNLQGGINVRYSGKIYTDNYSEALTSLKAKYPSITNYNDNIVDPFIVVNAYGSYELSLNPYFENAKLFFQINNLFDNLFASFGIGNEFFPAAERNFIFGVKLSL